MTVRARITLLATAVVSVVLVVAGIALVAQQRRTLVHSVDEGLHQRAAEARSAEGDPGAGPAVTTGLRDDDDVVQVVVGGEVVLASPNVDGDPAVVDLPRGDGTRLTTVDGLVHEDGSFRVLVERHGDRVLILAAAIDDIDDSVTTLVRSLVVGIPLVVVALAMVLWSMVGRALRPVEAIRAEVADIDARDLHRRVPVPPTHDEVGRLAQTMNDMLERIDDATQRQLRFLADASHELRSPLTRMRAELEVDLAHPDRADLVATHASLLEEAIGLQRLADDLLLVARADERGGELHLEPVDLDDVVLRVARRLRADDRVEVDLSGVTAGRVLGDRDQLARVVGNLADNAVRHARSSVRFGLRTDGDAVVLAVEDDGPGVPAADRERVFERFGRVDAARSVGSGGTGLGLAIARDLAEAHGGTLTLDATAGARFVLTLPAAPPD
ncbi:MAG: sensor histidine kinase [Acidimicrobiales bacterium]